MHYLMKHVIQQQFLYWFIWGTNQLVLLNIFLKPCHEPHALQLTTWGTIFTKICFGVSKKWVRSWSHASVVTNLKMFPKKRLTGRPKTVLRIRKRKKTMAIAKRFALYANAIMQWQNQVTSRIKWRRWNDTYVNSS